MTITRRNHRSYATLRHVALVCVLALSLPSPATAGPSKEAKRAMAASLVGHTITLTTTLYRYNDALDITTVGPSKALFYSYGDLADRDPQQLAVMAQALEERARS